MDRTVRSSVALLLLACTAARGGEVPLGTPFALRYGQTATFGPARLEVTFVDVDDSRCPRDVNCVWEGEAVVRFRVAGEELSIKLPGSVMAAGHRIELREVNPYPTQPPPGKAAYSAVVVVTTSGSQGRSPQP